MDINKSFLNYHVLLFAINYMKCFLKNRLSSVHQFYHTDFVSIEVKPLPH